MNTSSSDRMMIELKEMMLRQPVLTLSVAESLTCGSVQARIGGISGASDFFAGGMTAYTTDQKVRHLGVDRAEAERTNSVSGVVAEQMARGACVFFGTDLGLATTGYAEPAPKWKVVDPFAWWAIAHRAKDGGFTMRRGCVDFPGLPRTEVQSRVTESALSALVAYLREKRR